jgi:hypothetical protein
LFSLEKKYLQVVHDHLKGLLDIIDARGMVDLFLERFHNLFPKLRALHFPFEILQDRDNPFRVHPSKIPLQITAI